MKTAWRIAQRTSFSTLKELRKILALLPANELEASKMTRLLEKRRGDYTYRIYEREDGTFRGIASDTNGDEYPTADCATAEDAEKAAIAKVSAWAAKDAETEKEGIRIRAAMAKTHLTGGKGLTECECWECGTVYYYKERISDYSKMLYGVPPCPTCDESLKLSDVERMW
jgi:hypothetical protein